MQSSHIHAPHSLIPDENAACDLCFKKKIKCDMVQPVCSNCILYKTECRTSIIRRKGPGPKVKAPQPLAAQPEKAPSET